MEPLTWTGPQGDVMDHILYIVTMVFLVAVVARIILSYATGGARVVTNPDGTLTTAGGPFDLANTATKWTGLLLVALVLVYIGAGVVMGPEGAGIIGGMSQQLLHVWIALIVTIAVAFIYKRKLGLYG